jgi:hypothetical protein
VKNEKIIIALRSHNIIICYHKPTTSLFIHFQLRTRFVSFIAGVFIHAVQNTHFFSFHLPGYRPTSIMTSNVVDFEDILNNGFSDANTSIRGVVRARWERKKHESIASNLDCSDAENRKPLSMSDRFIPNRAAMDMEKSSHAILSFDGSESSIGERTDGGATEDEEHTINSVASDMSEYKTSVLGIDDSKSRILSFADKAPAPKGDTVNNLQVLYSASTTSRKNKSSTKLVNRHIPSAPTRILDAPDLLDDYYLNLLSWSDTNVLAVALSQTVYLWNAETGHIDELCNVESEGPDAHISSVSWIQEGGGHLAVGTSWVSFST